MYVQLTNIHSSRHDWKTVDWDVKNQIIQELQIEEVFFFIFDERKMSKNVCQFLHCACGYTPLLKYRIMRWEKKYRKCFYWTVKYIYTAFKVHFFQWQFSCMIFFKRSINLQNIVTEVFPWSVKPVRMSADTFVKVLRWPVYTNPYFGSIPLKGP